MHRLRLWRSKMLMNYDKFPILIPGNIPTLRRHKEKPTRDFHISRSVPLQFRDCATKCELDSPIIVPVPYLRRVYVNLLKKTF